MLLCKMRLKVVPFRAANSVTSRPKVSVVLWGNWAGVLCGMIEAY